MSDVHPWRTDLVITFLDSSRKIHNALHTKDLFQIVFPYNSSTWNPCPDKLQPLLVIGNKVHCLVSMLFPHLNVLLSHFMLISAHVSKPKSNVYSFITYMEEKSLLGWKSNWLCGNGKHRINVKIIFKVEVTIISFLFWTWRLILNTSLFRLLWSYLDSVLKTRDITLPTKVYIVKAVAFPVVVYGCESWTIKKAKH